MLAVDGEQLGSRVGHGGHENLAGGDEAFLVGERQTAALAGGLEGRLEAGGADDRRHDAVGRLGGSGNDGVGSGGDADTGAGERRLQLAVEGRIADDGETRARAARRLGESGDVALRGECDDLKGVRVALDEVERALADGAGGAEDGERAARGAEPIGRGNGGRNGFCHASTR